MRGFEHKEIQNKIVELRFDDKSLTTIAVSEKLISTSRDNPIRFSVFRMQIMISTKALNYAYSKS